MFDPTRHRRITEQLEERGAFDVAGKTGMDPDPGTDALWQSWHDVSARLQELGVAPAAMCDAVNEIASARAEVGDTQFAEEPQQA